MISGVLELLRRLCNDCDSFLESYKSELGLAEEEALMRAMNPACMAFGAAEEGIDEEIDEYDYGVESE
ncbi:hypothetical protein AX14_010932 [Amanita brunnescens Koide BX004]|nr:hypothetical protein AX14_010932 [Amanita brunnescens Koide BX004]